MPSSPVHQRTREAEAIAVWRSVLVSSDSSVVNDSERHYEVMKSALRNITRVNHREVERCRGRSDGCATTPARSDDSIPLRATAPPRESAPREDRTAGRNCTLWGQLGAVWKVEPEVFDR
jgi:hypothetical protein